MSPPITCSTEPETRAVCGNRSHCPDRHLRRQQTRRQMRGAGGVQPSGDPAHVVGLCAETGCNFVRTMLNAARKTDRLRGVADQTGCPTAAADLAAAILAVCRAHPGRSMAAGIRRAVPCRRHRLNQLGTAWPAPCSRKPRCHGVRPPEVTPIGTAEWPTAARRPGRIHGWTAAGFAAVLNHRLPPWRDGLARTIDAIFSQPLPGR